MERLSIVLVSSLTMILASTYQSECYLQSILKLSQCKTNLRVRGSTKRLHHYHVSQEHDTKFKVFFVPENITIMGKSTFCQKALHIFLG